jgi:hypothetical protein
MDSGNDHITNDFGKAAVMPPALSLENLPRGSALHMEERLVSLKKSLINSSLQAVPFYLSIP